MLEPSSGSALPARTETPIPSFSMPTLWAARAPAHPARTEPKSHTPFPSAQRALASALPETTAQRAQGRPCRAMPAPSWRASARPRHPNARLALTASTAWRDPETAPSHLSRRRHRPRRRLRPRRHATVYAFTARRARSSMPTRRTRNAAFWVVHSRRSPARLTTCFSKKSSMRRRRAPTARSSTRRCGSAAAVTISYGNGGSASTAARTAPARLFQANAQTGP